MICFQTVLFQSNFTLSLTKNHLNYKKHSTFSCVIRVIIHCSVATMKTILQILTKRKNKISCPLSYDWG